MTEDRLPLAKLMQKAGGEDFLRSLAALVEPWSTGPVEGQINRLKLLKRTMCGRASYDLLRCRVLAAA